MVKHTPTNSFQAYHLASGPISALSIMTYYLQRPPFLVQRKNTLHRVFLVLSTQLYAEISLGYGKGFCHFIIIRSVSKHIANKISYSTDKRHTISRSAMTTRFIFWIKMSFCCGHLKSFKMKRILRCS